LSFYKSVESIVSTPISKAPKKNKQRERFVSEQSIQLQRAQIHERHDRFQITQLEKKTTQYKQSLIQALEQRQSVHRFS
jgi:hypothetical protein